MILAAKHVTIGLARKLFRFFPLDVFSRSKSFFSIANFRPYKVFDTLRFIHYSVKKKFQVLLFIYCFALIWNEDSVRSFSSHCTFYFRKVQTVQARKKLYNVYGEKSLAERQCQHFGLLVFVPEILTSKMHHALDAQLKLTTTK